MGKRLTEMSKGSGCGCKIAPAVLSEILSGLTQNPDPKLLVGFENKDDAAIYDMGNGELLISTVDFFTPVVDDPYMFGKIAAANALSDIYAMGGKPLMALSVLGFPVDELNTDIAKQILQGGIDTCKEAGINLAGGHSINSPEPFFGLSVNGLVSKENLKTNAGAKLGDLLYLTKQIGSGIYNAAIKKSVLNDENESDKTRINKHVANMSQLNAMGNELSKLHYINAMTDITGFGFLGHINEMCEASNLSAEINSGSIPIYENIDDLLAQNCIPDNTYRNWNAIEKKVTGAIDMRNFQLLNDPQTNGGLLLAVDANNQTDFEEFCKTYNLILKPFGKFILQKDFTIELK